jgi:hypothetical protein
MAVTVMCTHSVLINGRSRGQTRASFTNLEDSAMASRNTTHQLFSDRVDLTRGRWGEFLVATLRLASRQPETWQARKLNAGLDRHSANAGLN